MSSEPEVWVGVQDVSPLTSMTPTDADVRAAPAGPGWRRTEFLAGRHVLRSLLRRVAPEDAGRPVVPEESGRPVLAGSRGVAISVSHDGNQVAVGVGRCPSIGVDIQMPPDQLSDAVVRRCVRSPLPPDPAERALEFAWIWSVQEACVKATGQGLAGAPWLIDVELGAADGHWGSYRWRALREVSTIPLSCAYELEHR